MTDISWEGGRFSAAWLLRRTAGLLRDNSLRVLIAMAVLSTMGTAADLGIGDSGLNFGLNFVTLAMQYWLTASLLDDLGLRLTVRPRFPAFFFLGILTTLGIIAGLVLLVVPGIVLMVRWSIAAPAVIASEDSAIKSLGYSWRETEGHFAPLLALYLVTYAPFLVGIAGFFFGESQPALNLPATVGAELALNGGIIAGWHAAVAVYAETRPRDGLAEVFA